ncbi:MAG: CBS domain-containing protein [Kofleriaceae bacterium]
MKKNVTVQDHMTPSPHTIGVDQPISKAKELLRLYEIRHLPVLRGGKLDGVISDRDLSLIEQLEVNADRLTVEDVMTSDVFEVAATDLLADVVTAMAARKLGSAIVVEHSKVIGILTTVDVCAALGLLLQGKSG